MKSKSKLPIDLVKNYVNRLNEADINYLYSRFTERYTSDDFEIITFVQSHQDMNRRFSVCKTSDEFLDLLDLLEEHVLSEYKKRYQSFSKN